jgi:hypothetical protein
MYGLLRRNNIYVCVYVYNGAQTTCGVLLTMQWMNWWPLVVLNTSMSDNNSDSSGEQYFYPKHCTKYNHRNFGKNVVTAVLWLYCTQALIKTSLIKGCWFIRKIPQDAGKNHPYAPYMYIYTCKGFIITLIVTTKGVTLNFLYKHSYPNLGCVWGGGG